MRTLLIRLVTALVPLKRARKRLRRRWLAAARDAWLDKAVPRVRERYARHVRACREKLARGEKLNVCFLVCDVSMFSAEPVYRLLRADERFAPFIAVTPRVTRGDAFLRATQEKALAVLRERYGAENVTRLYDPVTREETPLDGRADLVFTSIIYSDQTCARYTAEQLSRFALVAGMSYGYGGLFRLNVTRTVFLPEIAFMWRYFVSNEAMIAAWNALNPRLADTLALTGYAKMDRLAEIAPRAERPKTVVIAPHHSLPEKKGGGDAWLTLSTFLRYADLFRRLPAAYPDVKFVFRPHPLLFPRLATDDWWGAEKTDAYRRAMESQPNVEFQQGGDYFETFANSDALIHDCGSFLAEYFYTGKPQCYLLADDATVDREFLPFARRLLEHTCRAYSEADIRAFLDRVVSGAEDPDRAARDAFARAEVCRFHPHAAARVVACVTEALAPPRTTPTEGDNE